MLEYLIQLPYEVLVQKMLVYLELIDIIQFENAAASHQSQQLLREILFYCLSIIVAPSEPFHFHSECSKWFHKKRCHVKLAQMSVKSLCQVDFEHSVLNNIELLLNRTISLDDITLLNSIYTTKNITHLRIQGYQHPSVMDALFSLLSNSTIHILIIKSSNISKWFGYIKQIGPHLREFATDKGDINYSIIIAISEYCPYLEKLCCSSTSGLIDNNILQSIANNCPHLRSLSILVNYPSYAEAVADLTAFAEKCPQLEELSLHCPQLTDQSLIGLTQHCSRLKKLKLICSQITAASLIALSERSLPIEELDIPRIPIPSAEIAAQCAHALSRIRELCTQQFGGNLDQFLYAIQYMTGLRKLYLYSSEDHLLVPHLLLLLQGQCCAGLEILHIHNSSSITSQQLRVLILKCPKLQKFILYSSAWVTEDDVLALSVHCRQLREIVLPHTTLTEETVRQLAQHCRHLPKLSLSVNERKGEVMVVRFKKYSSKEIRELRENKRE